MAGKYYIMTVREDSHNSAIFVILFPFSDLAGLFYRCDVENLHTCDLLLL